MAVLLNMWWHSALAEVECVRPRILLVEFSWDKILCCSVLREMLKKEVLE